jgi:hypothetical protein
VKPYVVLQVLWKTLVLFGHREAARILTSRSRVCHCGTRAVYRWPPISLKVHFRAYSIAHLGISSATAMSPILLSARKSPTSSARLCGQQLGQRRIPSASRFIRRPVVPALQHPSPEHLPYNAIINASGCGAPTHVWGPSSGLNYDQPPRTPSLLPCSHGTAQQIVTSHH